LNQSLAAARAGAEVFHAGIIGSDGDALREIMAADGVNIKYLKKVDAPSGHAIIQVDPHGRNCIVIHHGANHAIDGAFVDRALSDTCPGDIVLTQNEISSVDYILHKAREKGALVAFNPSPITLRLMNYPLELVDILILNELEGVALTGGEGRPYEELIRSLAARFPQAEIILTVGKDGVLYLRNGLLLRHGSCDVDVVDTTAAGDTFCGYFLAGKAMGLSAEDCIRNASIASGMAVSKKGASSSIPYRKEVLAFSTLLPRSGNKNKYLGCGRSPL